MFWKFVGRLFIAPSGKNTSNSPTRRAGSAGSQTRFCPRAGSMPASLTFASILYVGGSAARASVVSPSPSPATPISTKSLRCKVMRSPSWRRGGLRRGRRERDGQGLAVGAGAQRLGRGDVLAECDRDRVVAERARVAEQRQRA